MTVSSQSGCHSNSWRAGPGSEQLLTSRTHRNLHNLNQFSTHSHQPLLSPVPLHFLPSTLPPSVCQCDRSPFCLGARPAPPSLRPLCLFLSDVLLSNRCKDSGWQLYLWCCPQILGHFPEIYDTRVAPRSKTGKNGFMDAIKWKNMRHISWMFCQKEVMIRKAPLAMNFKMCLYELSLTENVTYVTLNTDYWWSRDGNVGLVSAITLRWTRQKYLINY